RGTGDGERTAAQQQVETPLHAAALEVRGGRQLVGRGGLVDFLFGFLQPAAREEEARAPRVRFREFGVDPERLVERLDAGVDLRRVFLHLERTGFTLELLGVVLRRVEGGLR